MATFRFVGRDINIHWNGYDIKGPAGTVFSIPDQLYEEFESDIRGAEPSLEWIDTNEFLTLANSVSVTTLDGTFPIATTSTSTGRNVSIVSTSASDGYVLTANGSGGVAWEPLPGDATGITNIIGTSPISAAVAGTQATISINQSLLSVADASTASTLRTYVKNSSGSTITKGQAVYVTGADGTNALIGLASASAEATSSKTLGIAADTMTNNAFGYVIENGQLSNIDTSAATAGSSVWLGATPGSLVFGIPPAEPNHSVYLGVVTKANASTGEVLVKVQNGYELDELHDVFVGGVSTSLPLVYSSTSSGWVAQALTSVGIADNAIVAAKIAAGAVGSAAIAAGAVVAGDIAANAVTSGNIAASAITSGHIASGAVGSAALASNSVVAAKISASSITSGHISTGAVGSAALATGAVVSASIAASAVTSGHISAGAVGTAALATGAVVASKIATGAVTSGHIAAAAVGTAALSSGSAANGTVLTANGSGGATFASAPASGSYWISGSSPLNASSMTSISAGSYGLRNVGVASVDVSVSSVTSSIAVDSTIRLSAFSTLGQTTTADVSGWSSLVDAQFGTTTINDIAYANSLFVAVGNDGKLSTSINGTSWTSRTSGFGTTSNAIRAVAYGNSLWVTVGQSGKLFTSIDGTSWTSRTSGFGTTLINDVVYGNSLWVAVGQIGKLYTSTDAITWTSRTSQFSTSDSSINDIQYENSLFVASGWNSQTAARMSTSISGTAWTSRTTGFGVYNITGAAYGSSTWVAVANNGSNSIEYRTSSDAITWAAATNAPSGTGTGKVVFLGSRFRSENGSVVAHSIDGSMWTSSLSKSGISSIGPQVYDGSKYVAIALSGTSYGVVTSTLGLNIAGPIDLLFEPITYQSI